MSDQEFTRAAVLQRVVAKEMTLSQALPLLGVSYRQAKRLVQRYRTEGRLGLVHRARRRPSNHGLPAAHREQVLALVRTRYSGPAEAGPGQRFGPTLVAEHLWLDHGVLVSVSTLTRWMRAAGLWSRARRARPRHRRRERKAHFGELVQLDGSEHDWFEGRGPRACAMTMVDDATGTTLLRFSAGETIWSAAAVLQAWIAAYGVPLALYTDWKNVYLRAPTANEERRGTPPLTQFGRMCDKLGIAIIGASSPQAKGRVERGHGTHQDRLIKKLRLQGIADLEAANAFVTTTYLPAHNARFAIAPVDPVDYHRRRDHRRWPDATVFCLETERVVGNDLVVQYNGQALQLASRSRGCVPPKSRVRVRETVDGTLTVIPVDGQGRVHPIAWTPAVPRRSRQQPAALPTGPSPDKRPWRPAADHPWRHPITHWVDQGRYREVQEPPTP